MQLQEEEEEEEEECGGGRDSKRGGEGGTSRSRGAGTQFACFTSTKIAQIVTGRSATRAASSGGAGSAGFDRVPGSGFRV